MRKKSPAEDQKLLERRKVKIYFDNEDLDVYVAIALSRQNGGFTSSGEIFYACSQVDPKKPDTWAAAWSGIGERLERHAVQARDSGHPDTARSAWFRASSYHRTATLGIPVGDEWRRTLEGADACFHNALEITDPPVERVEVRTPDGWTLPGYFARTAAPGPAPTVIIFPGGEMPAADQYMWVGHEAARRGYHALCLEFPWNVGARLRNPDKGLLDLGETHAWVKAIVDFLAADPAVDGSRIAGLGYSGGGALIMHAALADPRIAAIVPNTPVIDLYGGLRDHLPAILWKTPSMVGSAVSKLAGFSNPFVPLFMEKLCWQFGADAPKQWLEVMNGWSIDPERLADIKAKVLCLAGEGEPEQLIEQTRLVHEKVTTPKAMRVFTVEDGADGHCQLNNTTLSNEVVFDWLDDNLTP